MNEQQDKEAFVNEAGKQVETYVKLRYELAKLEFSEKTAKIAASLFSAVLLLSLLFFTILFISLMAGFYFSQLLNSTFRGFGIIAAFYSSLLFILFLFRKQWIEMPFTNRIIRIIFNDHD